MVRRSALVSLRERESRKTWPLLLSILATEQENQNLRETAIKSLGDFAGTPAVEHLLLQLAESETVSRFGREAATNALKKLRSQRPSSVEPEVTVEQRDVFLCHASEDKHLIIDPLAEHLSRNGITYWLDEEQIAWGDSVCEQVNAGLTNSTFVIAVVSPHFLVKSWPQRELNALINMEAKTGLVRILVLLTGGPSHLHAVFERFPLLNDKLYLEWKDNPQAVVSALARRLGKDTVPLPPVKVDVLHDEHVGEWVDSLEPTSRAFSALQRLRVVHDTCRDSIHRDAEVDSGPSDSTCQQFSTAICEIQGLLTVEIPFPSDLPPSFRSAQDLSRRILSFLKTQVVELQSDAKQLKIYKWNWIDGSNGRPVTNLELTQSSRMDLGLVDSAYFGGGYRWSTEPVPEGSVLIIVLQASHGAQDNELYEAFFTNYNPSTLLAVGVNVQELDGLDRAMWQVEIDCKSNDLSQIRASVEWVLTSHTDEVRRVQAIMS